MYKVSDAGTIPGEKNRLTTLHKFVRIVSRHCRQKNNPSIPNRDERNSFRGTTRNSPQKRRAFQMLTHPRPLTQSPGCSYCDFRQQLPGESPILHISGSHHPAFAEVSVFQYKATRSSLFSYHVNINICIGKMQVLFPEKRPDS